MFAVTGLLNRLGMVIYKYLVLNLLFLLFCIPIVTIPASVAGLFNVARKYVYDSDPSIAKEFVNGFRQNFKQSSVVGLVLFVAGIFLFLDYRASLMAFGGLFMTLWTVLTFVALCIAVHVFPLMVHMNLKVTQILLNAVKLAMFRPLLSLLTVVFIFAGLCLAYIIPVLFFTCIFSTLATGIYALVNQKFKRLDIAGLDHGQSFE